jgi:hypothetical protein
MKKKNSNKVNFGKRESSGSISAVAENEKEEMNFMG